MPCQKKLPNKMRTRMRNAVLNLIRGNGMKRSLNGKIKILSRPDNKSSFNKQIQQI